jgi:hypothetical protein
MAGDYGPEIHVERLTSEHPVPVVANILTLADALTRIDALTAELARREDRDARNDVVLDVLAALVSVLGDRILYEHSFNSRRVLNALTDARATLAEAGR